MRCDNDPWRWVCDPRFERPRGSVTVSACVCTRDVSHVSNSLSHRVSCLISVSRIFRGMPPTRTVQCRVVKRDQTVAQTPLAYVSSLRSRSGPLL